VQFLVATFLKWRVAALKTCAIALNELKLAHPQLDDLPWGRPPVSLDTFRSRVVADIPSGDAARASFQALSDFWP